MTKEYRGRDPLMGPIEERLSPTQVSRLRFRASVGALSSAFHNLGKAARQATLVRWPSEMLTNEKLSPWASQEKQGL